MTTLEDRLRDTLHDLADEAVTAPLLQQLECCSAVHTSRRRLVAVAAAAAVAATVAAASYVVLRPDPPSIIEPVDRPPKVFRISGVTAPDPGRASLAVTLARGNGPDATYVLPSAGGAPVLLTMSDRVPTSDFRHLSADGTRLVRQNSGGISPRLEVANLMNGSTNTLGGVEAFCPQLSPDNRTIVAELVSAGDRHLSFMDVRSAAVRRGPRNTASGEGDCAALGWSPDGQYVSVAAREGTVVTDRRGRIVHRLPYRRAVNNSMSWSADGRLILMYDARTVRFLVRDLTDESESVLEPPAGALRPVGWAGSRVVWLSGQPGDQRLVTTDQRAADPRTWMRLDVGNRVVESVSWTRSLSGTARD